MAELVQALQQLDVALQAVNERTVEHVPADLCQRRLLSAVGTLQGVIRVDTARIAADPHHQHPVGAQVQRRADGGRLPHGPVAEILAFDFHRGKQQRDRRAGEQMINGQLRRHADAPMAQPGIDASATLIESHGLRGLIAERGQRHGVQLLLGDGLVDSGQIQFIVEQFPQW
ncbi:hypothetical protein D3C85_870880 [compost metagenome]